MEDINSSIHKLFSINNAYNCFGCQYNLKCIHLKERIETLKYLLDIVAFSKHNNKIILGKENLVLSATTFISVSKSDITNWLLHNTSEPR